MSDALVNGRTLNNKLFVKLKTTCVCLAGCLLCFFAVIRMTGERGMDRKTEIDGTDEAIHPAV